MAPRPKDSPGTARESGCGASGPPANSRTARPGLAASRLVGSVVTWRVHYKERAIDPRPLGLKLGALSRQEVEIVLSTVRERILGVHASQALELIEHARDHVPTQRALEIYCHLHRVEGHEAAALRTRVLASLGHENPTPGSSHAGRADAAAAQEGDSPWSWMHQLRRRLQGRKNLELRRWVELHSGRTQTRLLGVHVRGALSLIALLDPEGSYAEVVQLYNESIGVPSSLARVLYFLALSRLSGPEGVSLMPDLAEPAKAAVKGEEPMLRVVTK